MWGGKEEKRQVTTPLPEKKGEEALTAQVLLHQLLSGNQRAQHKHTYADKQVPFLRRLNSHYPLLLLTVRPAIGRLILVS